MKITPTPLTAALAGGFSASVMPALWPRVADDSLWLVLAFLALVVLPVHACVVGFGRQPAAGGHPLDAALLKRLGAWLAAAAVALALTWAAGR